MTLDVYTLAIIVALSVGFGVAIGMGAVFWVMAKILAMRSPAKESK